jgi:hypothetical protein
MRINLSIFNSDASSDFARFACAIVLFLLLPLVAIAWTERTLWEYPDPIQTKSDGLLKNANLVEVLILGTSHVQEGYRKDLCGMRTFNLAGSSQSLILDAQLVMKCLTRMPKLRLVVISLDEFCWGFRFDYDRNFVRNFHYRYFYRVWGDGYYDHLLDLRNISLFWLYGQPRSLELLLHPAERHILPGINENGFSLPTEASKILVYDGDVQRGQAAAAAHRKVFHTVNIAPNLVAIDELRQELKRHRVRMVFISEPIHMAYRNALDRQISQINESLAHIAGKQWGIPYFDYREDPRFLPDDFADPDHLNQRGADKLVAIASRDIMTDMDSGSASNGSWRGHPNSKCRTKL